jgi:hypothetical protein
MHGIVRSVLAVVAGYAAMAAVVILLTVIVKRAAPEWMGAEGSPNTSYLFVNLLYSFAAAMLGGYVSWSVAAHARLAHACALAAIIFLLSIVSATQMGDRQPRSYQLALVLIAPLGAIVGGWINTHR